MNNMMSRSAQKDEQILAAIIAGGVASGRAVLPGALARVGCNHYANGYGLHLPGDRGAVCAVGAGVLYAGIKVAHDPCRKFAMIHGVSESYARGVSDGFEGLDGTGFRSADYDRGWAVGVAAWVIFGKSGRIDGNHKTMP